MYLDYLYATGQLPPGTEPILDEGLIYGITVLTCEKRAIRVDIVHMAFNWRVVETELPFAMTYARYWCYSRRTHTLDQVVAEVRAWGGSEDSEPRGWVKATGDRRPSIKSES